MTAPSAPGPYKVDLYDESGEHIDTKIVIIKRVENDRLIQCSLPDGVNSTYIGFGAYDEEWRLLTATQFHTELAKLGSKINE